MRKAHATIVLTDYEQDLVREVAPDVACYRVPIARDIAGRSGNPWDDRSDILFVGGFEHPPNVDAVRHFTASIWPLVREKGLGARFIVVGSKMPEEVRQLAGDDVIVKGFVPDLDSVLDTVRLTVAPLRFGSGVKGKVVTSLSHGIPCVASSVAVEGTHFKHDVHLLVADDPQEIADVIEQAYTQRDLWLRLSENGITACRELYSVRTVRRHLATLLRDLGIGVSDSRAGE
jgi:glycosyltransferase involved in cell wall biosynthesis